ncbi:MAG: hypothetical protein ACLGHN_06640 [Bacteriovoracia bacterium]
MHLSYLLIFVTLSAFGQVKPKIEVMPNPKTPEDYEHQYKGCPENSECDQVMGLQMARWNDLVTKLKTGGMDSKKKAQYLELFRGKYGIPVEFYTLQKSQQGFKPLLFDSSCKNHNPKGGPKTLRGVAFLKSLSQEKGVVWRDQTQIEVPLGELLVPQPVYVFDEKEPTLYNLPLGDQPLFMKGKSLYVLKEEDGFFYAMKVGPDGSWKIEDVDWGRLSEWENKRDHVPCPKDPKNPSPKIFKDEFCKTIWNEDSKKLVVVKMHQGCAI